MMAHVGTEAYGLKSWSDYHLAIVTVQHNLVQHDLGFIVFNICNNIDFCLGGSRNSLRDSLSLYTLNTYILYFYALSMMY